MDQLPETETTRGVDSRTYQIRLSLYAEEFFRSLPLPAWVKVVNEKGELIMLSINKAYSDTYGIQPTDYAGKRDNVHWTSIETKRFKEQAAAAIRAGKPVLANSIVLNRITGQNERVCIIKWPLYYQEKVIGVAGIILERITISDRFLRTIFLLIPLKLLKWVLKAVLRKKVLP